MPAGIASKGATAAELTALLAERDEQVAFLTATVAGLEAAQAPVTKLDAASLDGMVRKAVAAASARIAASAAKADAAARRLEGREVAKQSGIVPEALAAARERAQRPETFWRTALAELAESIAPQEGPAERMTRVLATPEGKLLVRALTGDFRDHSG